MAYRKSDATCDGDHAGYGTDTGEIGDDGEIFCKICFENLKEENNKLQGEIEELQKKLENTESELNIARADRDDFEAKVRELEEQLAEKGGG